MRQLTEVSPGRWRFVDQESEVARSDFARPHVINDSMPPTEQVDGKHYTSKAAFRAVGRALGLTEVGTERPQPRRHPIDDPAQKAARKDALRQAFVRASRSA